MAGGLDCAPRILQVVSVDLGEEFTSTEITAFVRTAFSLSRSFLHRAQSSPRNGRLPFPTSCRSTWTRTATIHCEALTSRFLFPPLYLPYSSPLHSCPVHSTAPYSSPLHPTPLLSTLLHSTLLHSAPLHRSRPQP